MAVGPGEALYASAPVHMHGPALSVCGISGKGKRGRVFVRFAKCAAARGTKAMKRGRMKGGRWEIVRNLG